MKQRSSSFFVKFHDAATVRALEKVGLKLSDVESVYLPPPDANAAFAKGELDGWFVWEPFVARNVSQSCCPKK